MIGLTNNLLMYFVDYLQMISTAIECPTEIETATATGKSEYCFCTHCQKTA